MSKCLKYRKSKGKNSVPLYLEEKVWATPNVPNGGQTTSGRRGKKTKHQVKLQHQVGQWATPRATKTTSEKPETWAKRNAKGAVATPPLGMQAGGRLNPNWVEQLMGLPVGWTQLPTEWID